MTYPTMQNPFEFAKNELANLVKEACEKAIAEGALPEAELPVPPCEEPNDPANGDLSSTFALTMAKKMRTAPRKIAEAIVSRMDLTGTSFKSVAVAGAGFINVTFGAGWYGSVLESIAAAGETFGALSIGQGKRVMLEFVSANPTGPMHLGNARGGVLGDTLASLMERAGYQVWREFYVNNAGNQVAKFAESLEARYIQHYKGADAIVFPEDGYQGAYITDIAVEYAGIHGDKLLELSTEERRAALAEFGLEKNIASMKVDMARYQVNYDCWFLESDLHDSGYVAETVELMEKGGFLYEKDGAKWLRTSDFGSEKDEVIVKSNGFYTYYAVDLAYHRNKFEKRGFDLCINALGADHHGHVRRFKAGLTSIGVEDPDRLQFMLYQLVELKENGEAVRMSKRTGKAITLSTLLDEIPVDAARFTFNSKNIDSHLEFDLALAVKQESDNPVYYVQYAHARICSLLSRLRNEGFSTEGVEIDYSLLTAPEEIALIKKLASLPEEIRIAVRDFEPARMTKYLTETAALFHSFYNAHRIREAERPLALARMKLCEETRSILANVLGLLKVSAPERM